MSLPLERRWTPFLRETKETECTLLSSKRSNPMAVFRYEIRPVAGGWQVACNGVSGPPYATRDAAVLDTLAIAARFRADGHAADLRVFDHDGTGRYVEAKDAKLFRRS